MVSFQEGEKVKILSKPIPAFIANAPGEGEGQWTTFSQGHWQVLGNNLNTCTAIQHSQIDLGGLSQREKTIFFNDLEIQMPYPPSMLDAIAGDNLTLQLLISDQPIDNRAFYGPGQASSDTNPENMLIMRTQIWLVDQDTSQWGSVMKLASETASGLMSATASDTIYIAYYVQLGTKRVGPEPVLSTLEKFTVPPLLIVMGVDVKEESQDQYVMRLRRSYELSQTDRD